MDTSINYKYEIAFSFMQLDERIAYQINDLIQDRIETFIYSKRQEELGGTDGEKKFNEVFYKESRIVVLLYREGWGKTPWTRIEETAIRNRAFDSGWEFLFVVNLEKNSMLPTWIPKTLIWFDFERWKSDGLAPVLDCKVKESGGKSRLETLEDKSKRLQRLQEEVKVRDAFLISNQASLAADNEVQTILILLKESKIQIENTNSLMRFSTNGLDRQHYEFGYKNYFLLFVWRSQFFDLKDKYLEVFIYEKIKKSHLGLKDIENNFEEKAYKYDRNLAEMNVWVGDNRTFTSKELVFYWVSKFIDFLSHKEKNRN